MCSFLFLPDRPTDRPTFTRGRAMGNETFYWDGLARFCLTIVGLSAYVLQKNQFRLLKEQGTINYINYGVWIHYYFFYTDILQFLKANISFNIKLFALVEQTITTTKKTSVWSLTTYFLEDFGSCHLQLGEEISRLSRKSGRSGDVSRQMPKIRWGCTNLAKQICEITTYGSFARDV